MESIIIDTGPIVSLFDKDDTYHHTSIHFLKNYKGRLVTTWSIITEVMYLLDFNNQTQFNFLSWVERGAIQIEHLMQKDISLLGILFCRYKNVPMDIADASLMVLSEKKGVKKIWTFDKDFFVYRSRKGEAVDVMDSR